VIVGGPMIVVPGGGENVVFGCAPIGAPDCGIGASGWPGGVFRLGGTLMFGSPRLGTLLPGMPGLPDGPE
jgi:hypothetical protein